MIVEALVQSFVTTMLTTDGESNNCDLTQEQIQIFETSLDSTTKDAIKKRFQMAEEENKNLCRRLQEQQHHIDQLKQHNLSADGFLARLSNKPKIKRLKVMQQITRSKEQRKSIRTRIRRKERIIEERVQDLNVDKQELSNINQRLENLQNAFNNCSDSEDDDDFK